MSDCKCKSHIYFVKEFWNSFKGAKNLFIFLGIRLKIADSLDQISYTWLPISFVRPTELESQNTLRMGGVELKANLQKEVNGFYFHVWDSLSAPITFKLLGGGAGRYEQLLHGSLRRDVTHPIHKHGTVLWPCDCYINQSLIIHCVAEFCESAMWWNTATWHYTVIKHTPQISVFTSQNLR